MKQTLRFLILAALTAGNALSASAFDIEASHAVILDYETGIVLYEKQAREPMIPASMTKIMTAHMVLERLSDGRLSPDDEFTVSENAWIKGGAKSGGSTMFLSPNSRVKVIDLLKGIIVQSGNDACIVVAENISGSEEAFAAEMTEEARKMGLSSATFKNATGLEDEGHLMSAVDLAKLSALTIRNHPEYYKLYAMERFEWNGISQPNRNPLLQRFEGADGLKTGHLEVSGYGLVGSAVIDGVRRITVINGTSSLKDRADVSARIMRAAFREFSIATPFVAGDEIARADVWLGKPGDVGLTLTEDMAFGFETAEKSSLKAQIILDKPLVAPLEKGIVVGKLLVTGKDGLSIERDILTAESVGRVGMIEQAIEGFVSVLNPPKPEPASIEP